MATTDVTPFSQLIGSQASLFTGIGGLDLGLERAGFKLLWQSEIKPHAVAVIKQHWPHVPNLGDITTINWSTVETPTLLHGGFPCQDISTAHTANPREALAGKQSGLWSYYRDAVEALEPPWVLVENVNAWRHWVPQVRADLSRIGYASMPMELSAGSFGAPHRRPRCFVVAHANGHGEPLLAIHEEVAQLQAVSGRDSRYWQGSASRVVLLDDGLPSRMVQDDLYGNAVVPAVAEWLGGQIMAQIAAEQAEAVA